MDRAQELEHLRQAERHIDEAKALIETQREFVRELTQKDQNPEVANSGLRAMERTLKAFERHSDVILSWLKAQKPSEDAPTSTSLPSD
jgi:phospholipid N-methyltransferase